MKTTCTLSCAVISLITTGSIANVASWDNRENFLSAIAGQNALHDDFESYQPDSQSGTRTISFDGFDATYHGSSIFGIADLVDPAIGVGPTSGQQYLIANFSTTSVRSVTFTFDDLISDFGIYIRDLELTSLTYQTDSGLTGTAAHGTLNNTAQFFGLTTSGDVSLGLSELAFSEITFTMEARTRPGEDGVVFDQMTFVPTVPAPSTLALLSLTGLLANRRRRSH